MKEKESIERKEGGLLVKGMRDTEEKEKYRLFLAYCEERRREWRKQEEEDHKKGNAEEKGGRLETIQGEYFLPQRE